jgi:hypothetical protein
MARDVTLDLLMTGYTLGLSVIACLATVLH